MKIDAFLSCLGYYGVSTGAATSLEGAYSLGSGTTGIFYNQLYSTGSHFVNGQIYAPTLPLINVYGNNLINNNILSGNQGLRVGYLHTGNFSLVMDIEYSGCSRAPIGQSMVLLSTASSPSGLTSGFIIGITEANRIYFHTSGYSKTLDKELSIRDFIYVSLAESKYVTLGIYSFNDNNLYKKNIQLSSGILNSNDIYIGNFLLNTNSRYTGFSGKINQVVLFNDSLADSDVSICSNCALTTGFNTGTSTYSFLVQQLTGMFFSGVTDSAFTGFTNITGRVTSHDGSTISVILQSGMTGYFQTGSVAIPMFSGVTLQGTRNTFAFNYDTTALNTMSTFSVSFDLMLSSGDVVEVYSYPQPNTNIGKLIQGIEWPTGTGTIQLIANGLNETLGTDYYILRNEISGYSPPDDVLSYDILSAPPIITAYSGYWNDISRLQMSGGGFFPSAPQYFENTTNFSGIIKITGLSGICISNPFYPLFGYDLHINGQKLISGVHYNIVTSGTSGFVINLSGTQLPALIVYGLYDITGGGPTGVSFVDDNELAFIPEFSGFQETLINVTGDGFSYGPITGFGEQIWINGIRQLRDLDYTKIYPCSAITGVFKPPVLDFILYNSDQSEGIWNLNRPPALKNISSVFSISSTGLLATYNGLAYPTEYPMSGVCIEVWESYYMITGNTMSSYVSAGVFPTGNIRFKYFGQASGGAGIIDSIFRYNYLNVVGPWSDSPRASVV